MPENIWDNENLVEVLQKGGVAIMPTDTIYGMVGKAENENTVERIYEIKNRNSKKPCIVLIGNMNELKKFSVVLSEMQKNKLKEFWINGSCPTSIVLDCPDERFFYLHRGGKTLAFRIPALPSLRNLLLKTGPLIAPSANLETIPPSENVEDAKKYFGDSVDLYLDGGTIHSKASKLIKLHKDGSITVLRA
jgi:L-threonylcarbamoyladenylate synthase